TNMMCHFRILPNCHGAVMKELSTVHHSALAATKDHPGVIVIVFEVGGPVVVIKETVLLQRAGAHHKAGKIRAVGSFVRIDLVTIVKAEAGPQIDTAGLSKLDELVQ